MDPEPYPVGLDNTNHQYAAAAVVADIVAAVVVSA